MLGWIWDKVGGKLWGGGWGVGGRGGVHWRDQYDMSVSCSLDIVSNLFNNSVGRLNVPKVALSLSVCLSVCLCVCLSVAYSCL